MQIHTVCESDNAYNILGSHRMFTEDDLIEFMENREMVVSDHHKLRENT